MKTLKRLLLLFSLLISLSAFSGAGGGNGGDGVYIGEKLYLLDLVEYGIENSVVFDEEENTQVSAQVRSTLRADQFPVELISKKLSEIYKVDRLFAYSMIKVLKSFRWNLVSKELINIKDENAAINSSFVQLAIRKNRSVMIDKNLWAKLDPANQAALIFHELLYVMVIPTPSATNPAVFWQNSALAREMAGYLMSSDLKKGGKEVLYTMIINKIGAMVETDPARVHAEYVSFLAGIKVTVKDTDESRIIRMDENISESSIRSYCQNPNRIELVEQVEFTQMIKISDYKNEDNSTSAYLSGEVLWDFSEGERPYAANLSDVLKKKLSYPTEQACKDHIVEDTTKFHAEILKRYSAELF